MFHHVKGFSRIHLLVLSYSILGLIWKAEIPLKKIIYKILNLAVSVTNNGNQVSVFGLVIRDDKLNKTGNETNDIFGVIYGTRQLLLINNKNNSGNILNKNSPHFKYYGTNTNRLVNNFYYRWMLDGMKPACSYETPFKRKDVSLVKRILKNQVLVNV